MTAPRTEYPNFSALTAAHVEGRDYDRCVHFLPGSPFAVIAPHGGRIEPETDTIAREIAGDSFSFYCFRSHLLKRQANLHITSHRFDDPACLNLIAKHRTVITVHGWGADGERVLIGGLDVELITRIAAGVRAAGITATTATSSLSGTEPSNICNRGSSGRGVQLELTMPLRCGRHRNEFTAAIRQALVESQRAF